MKEVEEILLGGMFRPSEQNCPIRDGELIESLDKIYDIPNPRLGMRVYVQNTGKEYVVKSLKAKKINGVNVPNAAVDEFVEDVNFTTEDKMRLDAGGATNVVWENVINPSNMDNFTTAGTYNITGERTRNNDNLPIANTGGGHTFSARLVVLDSSISGTGIDTDKCVTQIMSFSNRVGGDGNVYIRTGRGASLDSLSWDKWATLQTNVNVGQVSSLDSLINNGIYSGIYTDDYTFQAPTFIDTFTLIVINNYAVASKDSRLKRTISQLKYAVDAITNQASVKQRTKTDGDDKWSDWTDIGGGSAEVDITDAVRAYGLPTLVAQGFAKEGVIYIIKARVDNISNDEVYVKKFDNNDKLRTFIASKRAEGVDGTANCIIKMEYIPNYNFFDGTTHNIIKGEVYMVNYHFNFYIHHLNTTNETVLVSADMTTL